MDFILKSLLFFRTLIETRSDLKFNLAVVDVLIRCNLVNILQFDGYLANALQKGKNLAAMTFAIPLVRMYCVNDRFSGVVKQGDFFHTVSSLQCLNIFNQIVCRSCFFKLESRPFGYSIRLN